MLDSNVAQLHINGTVFKGRFYIHIQEYLREACEISRKLMCDIILSSSVVIPQYLKLYSSCFLEWKLVSSSP